MRGKLVAARPPNKTPQQLLRGWTLWKPVDIVMEVEAICASRWNHGFGRMLTKTNSQVSDKSQITEREGKTGHSVLEGIPREAARWRPSEWPGSTCCFSQDLASGVFRSPLAGFLSQLYTTWVSCILPLAPLSANVYEVLHRPRHREFHCCPCLVSRQLTRGGQYSWVLVPHRCFQVHRTRLRDGQGGTGVLAISRWDKKSPGPTQKRKIGNV